MSPRLAKIALVAHVASSVGWLGAVAAFLALAVTGLVSGDAVRVRAVYVAADVVTWLVIVPASVAALVTGVVQGLGTTWGLFRHWWVVIKLALTVVATLLLLVHTQPIGVVARAAAEGALASGAHDLDHLRELRVQLAFDAAAALAVLLVTTTLSVVKPRGHTRWGRARA